MSSFTAGVIVIGDEILSGRTLDTNSNFIAKKLIDAGIELVEVIVIQDKKKTIIEKVLNYSSKYSYVFTTGGIGPTHDDITSESISEAFELNYEFNQKAFEILSNYYPKGEFNESRQRMAKMPAGSELIINPMTAAPGFKIKNVYVLPGVPEIMQVMFTELVKTINKGNPKITRTINTDLYESKIANHLKNIQNKYKDSSIGSYPYFNLTAKTGGVNIVVSSWNMKSVQPIVDDIVDMIKLNGGKSSIV
jgi:molybdenum cofactor synthesis domain-containing protein